LQQHLSRTERLSAMGKMVSALAHQIRTPLSAAILYAGHLCNQNLDEEKRSSFSQKVLSRLNHMERQVRDMLLFVKTELPLNDLVSVEDLQFGLREATEVLISSAAIECDWQIKTETKTFKKCHREALISGLVNLINNAIQAKTAENTEEPYLQIHMLLVQNELRIDVIDCGPGMSEHQLESVQEMFITTKPQGTGLGLAVVKAVARAHGGKFEMRSHVGVGTTASVVLPI